MHMNSAIEVVSNLPTLYVEGGENWIINVICNMRGNNDLYRLKTLKYDDTKF